MFAKYIDHNILTFMKNTLFLRTHLNLKCAFINLWVFNLQFGSRLRFMNYIKLSWYLHFSLRVSETQISYIRKSYGNFLMWQLAQFSLHDKSIISTVCILKPWHKVTERNQRQITNETGINDSHFKAIHFLFCAVVLHKSRCWSGIWFLLLLLQVSVLILSSRWDFVLVIRSIAAFSSTFPGLDTESISMMDCGAESRGELWHLHLFFWLGNQITSPTSYDVPRRALSYVANAFRHFNTHIFISDLHHHYPHQPWKTSSRFGPKSHGCMVLFSGPSVHLEASLSFKHLPGLLELHARLSTNMQLFAHWDLLQ